MIKLFLAICYIVMCACLIAILGGVGGLSAIVIGLAFVFFGKII